MTWISSTSGYFLLAHYMDEIFYVFHLGIVRSGMGWYNLLYDEGFEFLYPPCLYVDMKNQPQQGIYFCITIVNTSDPLSSWWRKIRYWCNTLQRVLGGIYGETGYWSAFINVRLWHLDTT